MVKIRKNFIKLCCLILLLQIGNGLKVSAKENSQPVRNMELLFVIDNSGSVRKEAASILKTIDLLQDWLNKEPLISSVQYIAMADGSKYAEYGNFPALEQHTCIKSGIELADKWLEERLGDGKVKGIVFVTDLVESHRAVAGKSFDKSAEQKDISDILNHWETDYSDEMDYFFITWKTEEDSLDPELEFVCEIPDTKLFSLKKDKENGAEKTISEIEMTGMVMKNIVEILAGVELDGNYKTSALKQINLKNTSLLYGYIILEKADQLAVTGEQGDLKFLDVQSETDCIHIYRLTEQDAGKVYHMQSDNPTVPYYLFYIPKKDLLHTFNHGMNVREGEKFDISISFRTNDYRQRMVENSLYIRFFASDTGEKTEIKLEETDGAFMGSGVLQRAGTYAYEICNEEKEVLEDGEIEVKANKPVTSGPSDKDTRQPDDEPHNLMIIMVAVILALSISAVVAVVLIANKKGKERIR